IRLQEPPELRRVKPRAVIVQTSLRIVPAPCVAKWLPGSRTERRLHAVFVVAGPLANYTRIAGHRDHRALMIEMVVTLRRTTHRGTSHRDALIDRRTRDESTKNRGVETV